MPAKGMETGLPLLSTHTLLLKHSMCGACHLSSRLGENGEGRELVRSDRHWVQNHLRKDWHYDNACNIYVQSAQCHFVCFDLCGETHPRYAIAQTPHPDPQYTEPQVMARCPNAGFLFHNLSCALWASGKTGTYDKKVATQSPWFFCVVME